VHKTKISAIDSGFALESSHPLRVLGKGFGQDFQRHVAAELGVIGTVHLTHSAFTDRGGDPIICESTTNQFNPHEWEHF